MIQKPLTFLFMLIFIGAMFLSNMAFAYEPLSLTQSYGSISDKSMENTSAKKVMRQQLQDMLLEQSLDRYFSYDVGVNRSTGIKVHSSLGLKIRSDETYLQFKMSF